ncbi:MAG: hypothetical protein RBJ76_06070 [Stenomitos frigidus ULC029]
MHEQQQLARVDTSVRAALESGVRTIDECLSLSQLLKEQPLDLQLWLLKWLQRNFQTSTQAMTACDAANSQLQQYCQPELVWNVLLLELRHQRWALSLPQVDLPASLQGEGALRPQTEQATVEVDAQAATAQELAGAGTVSAAETRAAVVTVTAETVATKVSRTRPRSSKNESDLTIKQIKLFG